VKGLERGEKKKLAQGNERESRVFHNFDTAAMPTHGIPKKRSQSRRGGGLRRAKRQPPGGGLYWPHRSRGGEGSRAGRRSVSEGTKSDPEINRDEVNDKKSIG